MGYRYTAQLGPIIFGQPEDDETIFTLGDLQGWDEPVSSGVTTTRTDTDGGWSTRAHVAPRPMHLSGSLQAPDWGRQDELIDRLLAAIPLNEFEPLTVTRDGVARRCYVRLDGAPEVELQGKDSANFDIPLIAADPFKYAEDESSTTLALASITGGLTFPTTFPSS